ncbi:vomeronasal type-1 receptor 4-like [Thomomys bottae]
MSAEAGQDGVSWREGGSPELEEHFSLLYCLVQYDQCPRRPTDSILRHFVLANVLTILCKGAPLSTVAFQGRHLLDDLGCKVPLSTQSGRGMGPHPLLPPQVHLCWALQLALGLTFPLYAHTTWILTNHTKKKDFQHCSLEGAEETS